MKDKMKNSIISSFIEGMGSIFDIEPLMNKREIRKIYQPESDINILKDDWYTIGKDISKVFNEYDNRFKRRTNLITRK